MEDVQLVQHGSRRRRPTVTDFRSVESYLEPAVRRSRSLSDDTRASFALLNPRPQLAQPSELAMDGIALGLEQHCLDQPSRDVFADGAQSMGGEVNRTGLIMESPGKASVSRKSRLGFEEFARRIRLQRHCEDKARLLRKRQRSLDRAAALAARLLRVGKSVHCTLGEISERGDKPGFIQVYNAFLDLKDNFSTQWIRDLSDGDIPGTRTSQTHSEESIATQASPPLSMRTRADILELVKVLRTGTSFLIDRLKGLSAMEQLALGSCPRGLDFFQDSILPGSASHRRHHSSHQKRNLRFSTKVKDFAFSLERSDPFSILFFNMYGVSLDPDSPERNLRLDVWSSVCASLYGDSVEETQYNNLFNHVLNASATLHAWRAKRKLELFLMNLLQEGAFLVSEVENANSLRDFESPFVDPLTTPPAESFLSIAVQNLFDILNDQDGGLPYGALQFGRAVIGKLNLDAAAQSRFRGYLFFDWFFCEFLQSAIVHPETQGMLLQSHVGETARQYILYQVWFRAQATVFESYKPNYEAFVTRKMKIQIEQMVLRLSSIEVSSPTTKVDGGSSSGLQPCDAGLDTEEAISLIISFQDILSVLNALYPRPQQSLTQWDPFLISSASTFAAQYSQTRGYFSTSARELSSGASNPGSASLKLTSIFDDTASLSTSRSSRVAPDHGFGHFDHLRRELMIAADLGSPSQSLHPLDESWLHIMIDQHGAARFAVDEVTTQASSAGHPGVADMPTQSKSLDLIQQAVLQLVDRHRDLLITPASTPSVEKGLRSPQSLESRFEAEVNFAQNRADTTEIHYWWNALKRLRVQYQHTFLREDDTRVLTPLIQIAETNRASIEETISGLESDFIDQKNELDRMLKAIENLSEQYAQLRDKLWYSVDVVHSNMYDMAKKVAMALNNMAPSSPSSRQPKTGSLRGRYQAKSVTESLSSRSQAETIGVMKASTEHGGPQKLGDEQVDATRKWLSRNSIDNFCKGEERIHRFCMEVKTTARSLVAESLTDSPVLWSSDLYSRERRSFENPPSKSPVPPPLTRPSSVISDDLHLAHQQPLHPHRNLDAPSRSQAFDAQSSPGRKSSFHSLGSSRFARDLVRNDTSSVGGSPGRAISATTTTESVGSVWSPLPTQTLSITSISSHSRPASTYNDALSPKESDRRANVKTRFIKQLQQSVIALLLSDLGCPVWSCGSETDAWLDKVLQDPRITRRIDKRAHAKSVLGDKSARDGPKASDKGRSSSASPRSRAPDIIGENEWAAASVPSLLSGMNVELVVPELIHDSNFSYSEAYRQLMDVFCKQANPLMKLQALHELIFIATAHIRETAANSKQGHSAKARRPTHRKSSVPSSRRSSLNPASSLTWSANHSDHVAATDFFTPESLAVEETPTEKEMVDALKRVLLDCRPKTLFRDLQYISAFVSPNILSQTENGKAFLQVGLAALAYKDEICQAMVEVAAKVIVDDGERRATPPPSTEPPKYILSDAEYFLVHAAREGNEAAQREIASLYLTHPHFPVITLPLSLARDIFRPEMEYWKDNVTSPGSQAMCLALHWMQHASSNGDKIAKNKLQERESSASIR